MSLISADQQPAPRSATCESNLTLHLAIRSSPLKEHMRLSWHVIAARVLGEE